jgi:hypothetical protein
MSHLDTLRAGVRMLNKETRSLQTAVSYVRVTARDEYGAPSTYAAPTTLHAVVDFVNVPVRSQGGITVMARATLTMLDVDEVVAATSGGGVDTDDEFTLPDGSTGKVLNIGGFMDPGTYGPIPLTVYLG